MDTEAIKMKGFIRVKLVDSETGNVVSEERHNFVNTAMKRVALAQSISLDLVANTGSPFGMIYCFNNQINIPYITAGAWLNFSKISDSTCLVLLKLDDSVELNMNTKMLPIFTSTGEIDYSKVTGYSVGRVISTNNKEGVINTTSAAQMIKFGNVSESFLFDTDIGTGEFNWLAIMPGFESHPWHSLQSFKCISNYNLRQSGDANQYGYIKPGVTDGSNVLTSENEVLLFFNHNGASKWKYNLVTGEMKAVDVSDLAYSWTSPNIVGSVECGNQIVVNGYLYAISGSNLYKINIVDGSVVSSLSVAYSSASHLKSGAQYGLWYDGTSINVSSCYNSTSYTNRSYIVKVNPSTMSKTSTTYNKDFKGWGGLPSTWNVNVVCFNKCGDVYYVYNAEYAATIVCTDIMNVCGSMVGIMQGPGTALFTVNNNVYHWYQSEIPPINISTEEGSVTSVKYPGFWISDETYSNFWSAAKLDSTKVKGASVKAYIDYGYEFE